MKTNSKKWLHKKEETSQKFTYGELAVFGEGNAERLEKIVNAKGDPKKLAQISPSFIVMDLTWRCNYHCLDCIDGEAVNKEKSILPVEIIKDIFDYSRDNDVRGLMTMGGEVFLHKQGMKTALEKSVEYRIPLKTVSNGSRLKSFINQIIQAYKIPGSMLRVSINSTKQNYNEQTGGNTKLKEVLANLEQIASEDVNLFVSTVVFPESSKEDNAVPNINELEEIIGYCKDAKIKTQILIPGRSPKTRSRYKLTDKEKEIIKTTQETNYGFNVEMGSFNRKEMYKNQDLNFNPCPSGFIFTLIGSDGKIYKCTDNRGRDSAVIGKIEKPGDFKKFWHSEERVKKQKQTTCKNQGCIRYKSNVILNTACETCTNTGVSMANNLKLQGGEITTFY